MTPTILLICSKLTASITTDLDNNVQQKSHVPGFHLSGRYEGGILKFYFSLKKIFNATPDYIFQSKGVEV